MGVSRVRGAGRAPVSQSGLVEFFQDIASGAPKHVWRPLPDTPRHQVTVPDFVSANASELLKGLLEKRVTHRLSAPEVKSHKFFLGVDWGKVERRE